MLLVAPDKGKDTGVHFYFKNRRKKGELKIENVRVQQLLTGLKNEITYCRH